MSLDVLKRHGIPSLGYESKSWDVFKDLVEMHIVITVCDNAAGEICPVFPGNPLKAHWGTPDPAHFQGTPAEIQAEFDRVYEILEQRIKALIALPVENLESDDLKNAIGHLA